MLDSLSSENYGDFQRRYAGCYGFFVHDEGNREQLVRIENVSDTEVSFVDSEGFTFRALIDTDVKFSFIQCDTGWFNTPAGAVLITRTAARQWQRGISDANTSVGVPTAKGDISKASVGFNVLNAVYQNKVAIEHAVAEFLDGERDSIALSKHFCMDRKTLYMRQMPIGEIDKNIIKVIPLFEQEMRDALRRSGMEAHYQLVEK